MSDFYSTRDTCRLCGSGNVELVVPLEPIPIATPNFRVTEEDRDSPIFSTAVPLELFLCRDCGHVQVLCIGNRDVQYTDYIYTTSISLGLTEHFGRYADDVLAAVAPAAGSLVVEFGSNDGTLLRFFKDRGMRVLGVDPAHAIAEQATRSGIETLNEFFSAEVAARIKDAHGLAAVVMANNVIANIDDLNPIALGVRELMAPDGVFVFETQYGADVFRKMLLDTVYHEHLSYFNVKPLTAFFERHGMQVIDVERIWTKGGSIRVTVQRRAGPRPARPAVAELIDEETREGLQDPAFYTRFAGQVRDLRQRLNEIADDCKQAGNPLGGYGVSVGTTTLLAQFGLTDRIDVLFDDDPQRKGELIGPGYRIPVFGPDAVAGKDPGVIVIFAWRYAEPIIAKHGAFRGQGGKFVLPLPEISFPE